MKRLVSAVMAICYGLAFAVVCLGGCLAPATASHSCCADEPGLRAPAQDCCQVVSGVGGSSSAFTPAALATVAKAWPSLPTLHAPAVREARASLTPSPPLVLRI